MAAMIRTVAMLGAVVLAGGCVSLRPLDSVPAPDENASLTDPSGTASAMALLVRGHLAIELDEDRTLAASYFERAALAAPDHLGLTILAGAALVDNGTPERAADLANRALETHRGSPRAYYDIGRLLWNSGHTNAARNIFREAVKLAPEYPQPRLGLAFIALQTGDPSTATELFESVRRLTPDDSMPYIGLAMTALETRDPNLASFVVEKTVYKDITDPALIHFYREFAFLLFERERFPEALSCLQAWRSLAPDSLDPYHLAAMTHAGIDEHDQARAILSQWPAAGDNPAIIADLLADIYEESEDRDRALQYALEATAVTGATLRAWLRAGRLLLMEDQPAQAASIMQNALNAYPGNETAWLLRGLSYSAMERYSEAVDALENAGELAREHQRPLPPMYDFWIGAAYERTERFAEAEHHFRQSIATHPELHMAHNYLAYMWADQGTKLDEALGLVETALKIEPDNGAYIDTLGWIYYRQGRHAEALVELKRALRKLPDHAVINEHVGDTLQALGRTGEAIVYWKRAFISDPDLDGLDAKLREAGVNPDGLKQENDRQP